ncbi:DUF124 domain-containing protein [Planoprotostelium fungivorum]|uniref:DUF124 domain-containing protein n=1 Tax=Planoprotostelium fungivorum TaxID=1890364 RepID=A0A2P6MVR4_9EUKA|nr:DUF124 domain-containing protein [Planoprotostelium fungivorum]
MSHGYNHFGQQHQHYPGAQQHHLIGQHHHQQAGTEYQSSPPSYSPPPPPMNHQQSSGYQQSPVYTAELSHPQQSYSPSPVRDNPKMGVTKGGYVPKEVTVVTEDYGSFSGGEWKIEHRDTNSILFVRLQEGGTFRGNHGAMVAMDTTIKLTGKVKFSFKKLFTGGQFTNSIYTGNGEALLSGSHLGDIFVQHLNNHQWYLGRHTYLASTGNIEIDTKYFGASGLFTGGLWTLIAKGTGSLFLSAFGAVMRRELGPGEGFIVDNEHLIAWNCKFTLQTLGGLMNSTKTGEGLVCVCEGPGTVYIQSKNPEAFAQYMMHFLPRNNNSTQ